MTEYDLIRHLVRDLPRSPRQRNRPFECDAELVELAGGLWALSMDEFSAGEDHFGEEDPRLLGANLATATLADLLAAGAEPRFLLQALALPRDTPVAVVDGVVEGLRSVLEPAGCAVLGGDLGTAESGWRFTGCALGPVPGGRALTRRLPPVPQTLWVTGPIGDANLAAVEGRAAPRFEYRGGAAAVIRQAGTACIDTSGGLADAFWLLHEQNPAVELVVDLDVVPLARGVAEFAARAGVPPEAFLLGGAGEYELLFAAPADLPASVRARLGGLGATPVGQAVPGGPEGVTFVRGATRVGRMVGPPPCPRAASSTDEHVAAVLAMAHTLFGSGHA